MIGLATGTTPENMYAELAKMNQAGWSGVDGKMVENGYLAQERSTHDRRSVRVKVSEKGLALCDSIASLHERHIKVLAEGLFTQEALDEINQSLRRLERFWSDDLSYGGRQPSGYAISSAA